MPVAWQFHTCAALNKSPGEHALSAVEPAAAPLSVNVLGDQDALALLKGQVAVWIARIVVQSHHPLHTGLRRLQSEQDKRRDGMVNDEHRKSYVLFLSFFVLFCRTHRVCCSHPYWCLSVYVNIGYLSRFGNFRVWVRGSNHACGENGVQVTKNESGIHKIKKDKSVGTLLGSYD